MAGEQAVLDGLAAASITWAEMLYGCVLRPDLMAAPDAAVLITLDQKSRGHPWAVIHMKNIEQTTSLPSTVPALSGNSALIQADRWHRDLR